MSNKGKTLGSKGAIDSNTPSMTVSNLGSVAPSVTTVPEVKLDDFANWVTQLYDVTTFTDDDISGMWEAFSYKGFNRVDVLKQLYTRIGDKRAVTELIVACAIRGPQAASRLRMSSGKTPIELGIPASGGQGTKVLTMNKIQAATADLAAYFLKRMNAPKRLNVELPGWLQFPSAGGIKLPQNLREQHIDFHRKFSVLIGGVFQEQIYMQMQANAYYDERLRLFE